MLEAFFFFFPVKFLACLTGTVSFPSRIICPEDYDLSLSFSLREKKKINTFKHLPGLRALHILQCVASNLQLLKAGYCFSQLIEMHRYVKGGDTHTEDTTHGHPTPMTSVSLHMQREGSLTLPSAFVSHILSAIVLLFVLGIQFI